MNELLGKHWAGPCNAMTWGELAALELIHGDLRASPPDYKAAHKAGDQIIDLAERIKEERAKMLVDILTRT